MTTQSSTEARESSEQAGRVLATLANPRRVRWSTARVSSVHPKKAQLDGARQH